MRKKRISCLLICEENKPVGIYTEADIVKTLNSRCDFHNAPVSDYMSTPVLTADKEVSVFEASYILTTHNIRHLVITEKNGGAAGIVTQTDIIAHLGTDYFIGSKSVDGVMSKNNLTASKESSVGDAIKKMECYSTGCVVIEENNKPIGILTERDIAGLVMEERDIDTLRLKDVMTSPVVTVVPAITTYFAVELMHNKKMRRLVVVGENGETLGVLLQDNLIRELEGNYISFLKQVLQDTGQNLNETREAFRLKSLHLENILRSSIDMGIVATDLNLDITYFNPEAERIFSKQNNTVIGTSIIELFPELSITHEIIDTAKQEIASQNVYTFSHTIVINNCKRHIESRITSITDENSTLVGYTLLSRDVSERRITEEKLLLASHVYDNAIEGIMVTDANGSILSVNPAFTRITGYSEEEVRGKNPRILQSNRQSPEFYKDMWDTLTSKGSWQGEIWNRRKNGETYPERLTISTVRNHHGDASRFISVFYDITDIKAHEEEIKYQAFHDPLTGLPNRLLFQDRLSQGIAHARRKNRGLTLMFLDIDNFKNLNDSLGHYAGDRFLQQISQRIQSCLREDDTVSRLGGDEFTILIEDNYCPENAITVAQKILSLFNTPFELSNKEVYLGVSIGIAFYPENGATTTELIKNADTAMYHAKGEGKNNFQFFKPELEKRIKQRLQLETDLRRALERDEFQIHYQPIVDLNNPEDLSLEVLLRWNKDDADNLISPNEFIPIAEQSGIIVPIGEWVLKRACNQTAKWIKEGAEGLTVSVNLSARQFREKNLTSKIENILAESGLPAHALNIEITESVMMKDMEASITTLKYLKELGIGIHVDDFGTGYSSFLYLKKFPVDVVKLDHTFMQDVVLDSDAGTLAAGMISMAKGMRLKVVAEGIETNDQLEFLKQHKCDKAQGFLFHAPLIESDAKEYFNEARALN